MWLSVSSVASLPEADRTRGRPASYWRRLGPAYRLRRAGGHVLGAGQRFSAVSAGDELVHERRELGEGTGRQGPWAEGDEEHRADKQEGDLDALEVVGDPRGGEQSDEYRRADPRTVVTEGDVAMAAPGGAPQEGKSVEERRAESEEWREQGSAGSPERANES